jgi:hypothetical protein
LSYRPVRARLATGKAQNARGGNEISHEPAGRARAHPFKAAESLMRRQIAERSFQLWFRAALAENRLRFFGAPASLARRCRRPSSRRGSVLKAYCALDNIKRPALRLGMIAI